MLHDYFFIRTSALPHLGSALFFCDLTDCYLCNFTDFVFSFSPSALRFGDPFCLGLQRWEVFCFSANLFEDFFLRFYCFSAGFQYSSGIAPSVFNPSVSGLQRWESFLNLARSFFIFFLLDFLPFFNASVSLALTCFPVLGLQKWDFF